MRYILFDFILFIFFNTFLLFLLLIIIQLVDTVNHRFIVASAAVITSESKNAW